jgi:hypothetical protein
MVETKILSYRRGNDVKMASTIVFLLTFAFVFLALGTSYGLASGNANIQNTMNTIAGPFPTISTANCSFSADGPTGNCNLLDLLDLGGIWLLASIGSLLFRLGAITLLMVQIVGIFSPLLNIPFIGPIFGFVIAIFVLYAWSHIRGNNPELG